MIRLSAGAATGIGREVSLGANQTDRSPSLSVPYYVAESQVKARL